jgi:endo-1,4-beta-D-glucanase Y
MCGLGAVAFERKSQNIESSSSTFNPSHIFYSWTKLLTHSQKKKIWKLFHRQNITTDRRKIHLASAFPTQLSSREWLPTVGYIIKEESNRGNDHGRGFQAGG